MEYSKDFSQLEFLHVTTTGRKTGLPREIEIWFVQNDGRLYILAEHFHRTQWVKNIISDPKVTVRLAGREFRARSRVLDPQRDAQLWNHVQQLAGAKYGWGDGLPVEIEIEESPL
jgi:deazaflavin-dependent oxidoreductase (nitroreductase family)